MGWASGSQVVVDIWDRLRPLLESDQRREAVAIIVTALDAQDWDTHDEAPLLMADAGEDGWEPNIETKCELCDRQASWFGTYFGTPDFQTCHNHVILLEDPEMLS